MNKREYRIYVVKQHFDAGVDSEVKRWALRGRFSCRHKALHKARVLSLLMFMNGLASQAKAYQSVKY